MSSHKDDLAEITDIFRSCASKSLSFSHPFTPTYENVQSNDITDVARDLDGLLTVTSLDGKTNHESSTSRPIIPLNLRDAMGALELGDKRMDCCEIPAQPLNGDAKDKNIDYTKLYDELITYPPRIAPKNLSDGTPTTKQSKCKITSNSTVLKSPCPSLLPYWDTLSLSPNSPTSILPLLLLQFTALEAYIGTNSGGSNATETLFCMLWCHEGVLMDMASRLNVWCELEKDEGEVQICDDEVNVARWALFASSLGSVRIAQAARCIVLDADIYEEEDFGVEWDWGEMTLIRSDDEEIDQSDLNTTDPTKSSFGYNQESRFVNKVWGVAISKLERFTKNAATDASVLLLKAQQSFYVTMQILYNLNAHNVVDFTETAILFTRETIELLDRLKTCHLVDFLSKYAMIASDGQLRDVSWLQSPETNQECTSFLYASFDPFVNRRFLGNAPIRKARFNPIINAINSISTLASELEWSVCDVLLHANTLGRLIRMLSNNSLRGRGGALPTTPKSDGEASSRVGINILCRSLMLLNLYFDDKLLGQYDFVDAIGKFVTMSAVLTIEVLKALRVFAAYELILEHRVPNSIKTGVTVFVCQNMVQLCAVPRSMVWSTGWIARLSKPLYDMLKALCLDRHRERLFTEAALLPAFGALQNEAAAVDEMFREANGLDPVTTSPYATNYVIVQTLRMMERHVGLGIELGLYPHWYDMSQAFWYRDFLLTALMNVRSTLENEKIERKLIEDQIQDEEEKKNIHQSGKAGGKKKKGKKSKASSSQTMTTRSSSQRETMAAVSKLSPESFEERIELTVISLQRSLCRGMVRLIAAMRQAELLEEPLESIDLFTSQRRMFEKRFGAFIELPQPPSLSYDDYEIGSNFSAVNRKDLISSAKECFRSGKSTVDRLLEVILPDDSTIDPVITEQRTNDDMYISIRRAEIMALCKVCVSNSLFLIKLETGAMQKSKEKMALVANDHKEFCTVTTLPASGQV